MLQRLEVDEPRYKSVPGRGNSQANALMQGRVPCVLATGGTWWRWPEHSELDGRAWEMRQRDMQRRISEDLETNGKDY